MEKTVLMIACIFSIFLANAQDRIKIDTSQSSVKWAGSNLFKFNRHYGTVKFKNGSILKHNDSISGGNFDVDMKSITNTDGKYNEMLVWHLKNEDFFNVNKYPTATLEITDVHYTDSATIAIKANMTIKNITKPIEFKSVLENRNGKMTMTSRFIIDRTQWNINYESKSLLNSIKDDIISDAIEFDVLITTK